MQGPKFADAEGIKTRYFEAGEGEPMVLVHGGDFGRPGNATDWEPVFHRLAESFHVYAIDKIGQGYTDNPKSDAEYVIGATVQHLDNFLKAVGLESAHVVGHSRGGYTVCRLALEHPEMARTVVLIDSATLMVPSEEGGEFYNELTEKLARIEDSKERRRYGMEAFFFHKGLVTEARLNAVAEIISMPKIQEAAAKLHGGGHMKGTVASQFSQDLDARQRETHEWIKAGGLKAPTLLVWGFNDPSAPLDPVGINAMRLILPATPRSQMHVLNQAGHLCFVEQPEAFVAAIKGFIKSS